MLIAPSPGLLLDNPRLSAAPYWSTGMNIRFRLDHLESIGLFGPLRELDGTQVKLPGTDQYRKIYPTPSTTEGQILAGSASSLYLIDYDTGSLPGTGTRWRTANVTPASLPSASDIIPDPSAGRIEVPPVWWFSDQDDIVVGARSNVTGEPAYQWNRNRGSDFTPLANSPTGAVGGAIFNRILILLGATSFTDPDPRRFLTIRWSDRFNFEDWTPSDINVSGELQLEGGSRIVGGGFTGFGVVVWTDRRMALLNETGDPDSVFARRYVDGGRGLMSNTAWTEANGQVWWFDEHRMLNVFDGGRPRQIQNPMRYATIERLPDDQTARAYLTSNPEFGEVILHYPDDVPDTPTRQLVYNYLLDCWYPWKLTRSAYCPRFGAIRPLGVDSAGKVWQHELDTGIPDAYITGPVPPFAFPMGTLAMTDDVAARTVPEADVEPVSFYALTNLITTDEVTDQTWRMTRILADHVPSPATGAEADAFNILMNGYGESSPVTSLLSQDWQTVVQGGSAVDMRIAGKALQIGLYGSNVKTVFRWRAFDITAAPEGVR